MPTSKRSPTRSWMGLTDADLDVAHGGLDWEGHRESENVTALPGDPLVTPGAFSRLDRDWEERLFQNPELTLSPITSAAELNNWERVEEELRAYQASNRNALDYVFLEAFGPAGWGPVRPEGPDVNGWILDGHDARNAAPPAVDGSIQDARDAQQAVGGPPVDGSIQDVNDARIAAGPPVDGTIQDVNDARNAAPAPFVGAGGDGGGAAFPGPSDSGDAFGTFDGGPGFDAWHY